MKNVYFSAIAFALLLLGTGKTFAQVKGQEMETYRRSSINLVMMEDPKLGQVDDNCQSLINDLMTKNSSLATLFGNIPAPDPNIASLVKEYFKSNPIPSKYNDHTVSADLKTFSIENMTISDEDVSAFNTAAQDDKKAKDGSGAAKAKGGLSIVSSLTGATFGPTDPLYKTPVEDMTKKNAPFYSYKYLMENNIAKKMMDRWFYDSEGNISISTLAERAAYNATEAEKLQAAEATGSSSAAALDYVINNGGWDLLSNTFVVVTLFRYYSAAQMAAEIVNGAAIAAQYMPTSAADIAITGAQSAASAAAVVIGSGYVIYSTSYLFRLSLDEEAFAAAKAVGSDEYNNYDFKLQYIGTESAYAKISGKGKTSEEAIASAVNRSVEKVLAKLEKKYEVFRTKTPLLTTEPTITAGIGAKECLEKGDKYEVLSVSQGKNGESLYKRVATLKVESVGNNMGADCDEEGTSADTFTTFSGKLPKTVHKGSLIRQIEK